MLQAINHLRRKTEQNTSLVCLTLCIIHFGPSCQTINRPYIQVDKSHNNQLLIYFKNLVILSIAAYILTSYILHEFSNNCISLEFCKIDSFYFIYLVSLLIFDLVLTDFYFHFISFVILFAYSQKFTHFYHVFAKILKSFIAFVYLPNI